jgi:hypothetical protein
VAAHTQSTRPKLEHARLEAALPALASITGIVVVAVFLVVVSLCYFDEAVIRQADENGTGGAVVGVLTRPSQCGLAFGRGSGRSVIVLLNQKRPPQQGLLVQGWRGELWQHGVPVCFGRIMWRLCVL